LLVSSISHLPVYSAPEPPVVKGLSPAHAILAVVLAVSGPESAAVCRNAALKSADPDILILRFTYSLFRFLYCGLICRDRSLRFNFRLWGFTYSGCARAGVRHKTLVGTCQKREQAALLGHKSGLCDLQMQHVLFDIHLRAALALLEPKILRAHRDRFRDIQRLGKRDATVPGTHIDSRPGHGVTS
ncbi:MAG TPA: hypothetical protein O0Y01_04475, partial [Methanocorpusculum sp.]|nr:hypothetical protein [Methanocorpusculum sp.]